MMCVWCVTIGGEVKFHVALSQDKQTNEEKRATVNPSTFDHGQKLLVDNDGIFMGG